MMTTTTMWGPLVALVTLCLMFVLRGGSASMIPEPLEPVPTTARPNVPATYWVTFSTRIRPGLRLPVAVHLTRAGASALVSVRLVNHSDHTVVFVRAPSETVIGGATSHIIYLQIPTTLKRPDWRHWFQYAVQVVASGDVSFNQSQTVTLDEKAFSVFVQTDKAIYKPGQTVRIRALAMNPDLTVMKEPMDIFIKDPLGNGIKRWENVQGIRDTGVVQRSLPTSTDPPLGVWQIDVTVREHTERRTFTIEKYVLPKFEAKLDVPIVLLISKPGLRGTVMAKYTFGKPLTGASAKVTIKYDYFWKKYNNATHPLLTGSGELDRNGEFSFFFSKAQLEQLTRQNFDYRPTEKVSLSWKRVKVIAEVTDVRIERMMKAEEYVYFKDEAAKVELLPLTLYTYKPGLRYTAYVKVTQPDGTLFPNYQDIDVHFNVTMFVPQPQPEEPSKPPTLVESTPRRLARMIQATFSQPHPYYRPEKPVALMSVSTPLTENGFLSFDVEVPAQAQWIKFDVKAMDVVLHESVRKAVSKSGNYLQITGQEQSPRVGQTTKLNIRTTEAAGKVIYQVYTKGVMVSETEASATDSTSQKFVASFPVTANMAPICKVLAFYVRPDGEVVADSLSFIVDISTDDQVQVSFTRQKVQPGEEVQMTVTARPDSVVFLSSVDKSVQLLKSGNDITQEMVSKELASYDFESYFFDDWYYMFICGWPFPSRAEDAYSVFWEANVAMLTDGPLYRSLQGIRVGPHSGRIPAPAQRVRKLFPETWLWDMLLIGPSGQSVWKTVVPDTITTWLTSAFAIHPQHGLSVIQQPAKLTTFKDLFVILDLPYSAVRGEDLCMKAFAFNYHAQATNLTMVMAATPEIDNIRVRGRQQYRRSETVSRDLGQTGPNEIKETLFCFTPRGLGRFPIRVSLTSTVPSADVVERMLLVEPEGTPRVTNVPVILDVAPGVPFFYQVPIQFPADTVQGSQRITVSVAGDLLGSVFENIDDLLRMPYGCGEQNMLYFAPNVFLIDYLQKTDTYTPERAEKAEKYMLIGYQKEIQYQHNDGSFSAFGNHRFKEIGSMWLTAFVVKCFAQSLALKGNVVSIEPKILQRAVSWMISQQLPDGSFLEPGIVFNKNMQGGSAKGEALTAYALIALAETKKHFTGLSPEDAASLQQSLSRSRSYLEQQLSSLKDPYDLAIVTYALYLTDSTEANTAFRLLNSKAIRGHLTLHWQRPKPPTPPRYYWQRQTDAINIEMTSYALLSFIARNDVAAALPIVRWLTKERGPLGGFVSTQDTVVGLQALALVATHIYQPTSSPITVTVVARSREGIESSMSVTLNDITRGLLQKVPVPIENNVIPVNVTIQATTPQLDSANSFAVAEVTMNYNVIQDTRPYPFRLNTSVQKSDSSHFILRIVASRTGGKASSMTLIEVGLLTGYDVDEDNPLYNTAMAKKAERKDKHYVLYFDEIGERQEIITLPMIVTSGLPLHPEPGVIQIYDYYTKEERSVKYSLQGTDDICRLQPSYEECSVPYRGSFRGFSRPRLLF